MSNFEGRPSLEYRSWKVTWQPHQLATELAWQVAAPLIYFLLMFRVYPYREYIWLGVDEGFNLMKAMLVLKGYDLYTQIWSDQPPLFTHLLAWLFRIADFKIGAARVLVLMFACILLWAVMQFMRLTWGSLPALAAAIVLFLLPFFPVLSVAVVIGLPAIALAMVSMLALALWHRFRWNGWLVFSGILLGASIMVKLFTGFLAPIFVTGLVLAEFIHRESKPRSWKMMLPAVIWGLAFGIFTLTAALAMIEPAGIRQLIEPHWVVRQLETAEAFTINAHLVASVPIVALAVSGIMFTIQGKRWLLLYPLAWMAVAYLLLLNYRPVWEHLQLLVTVPAAMLAGGAAGEALRQVYRIALRRQRLTGWWVLTGGTLILLVWAFIMRLPAVGSEFLQPIPVEGERHPAEVVFLRKIEKYAPQTHWMVTDLAWFAFQAGIPVPPELAVISGKRLSTGNLSEAEVLENIKAYQPEQVLFGRFDFPSVEAYLAQDYLLIHEKGEVKLYVRKDLLK